MGRGEAAACAGNKRRISGTLTKVRLVEAGGRREEKRPGWNCTKLAGAWRKSRCLAGWNFTVHRPPSRWSCILKAEGVSIPPLQPTHSHLSQLLMVSRSASERKGTILNLVQHFKVKKKRKKSARTDTRYHRSARMPQLPNFVFARVSLSRPEGTQNGLVWRKKKKKKRKRKEFALLPTRTR